MQYYSLTTPSVFYFLDESSADGWPFLFSVNFNSIFTKKKLRTNLGFFTAFIWSFIQIRWKNILKKRLCRVGDHRFLLYIIVCLTIMNTSVQLKKEWRLTGNLICLLLTKVRIKTWSEIIGININVMCKVTGLALFSGLVHIFIHKMEKQSIFLELGRKESLEH